MISPTVAMAVVTFALAADANWQPISSDHSRRNAAPAASADCVTDALPELWPVVVPVSATASAGSDSNWESAANGAGSTSLFSRLFRPAARPRKSPEPLPSAPTRPRLMPLWPRHAEPPSDLLLASRCRSLLYADPELVNCSIHAVVDQSVATLSGAVQTETQRQRAERIARKADGIRGVRNELQVSPFNANVLQDSPIQLSPPRQFGSWTPLAGDPVATQGSIPPDPAASPWRAEARGSTSIATRSELVVRRPARLPIPAPETPPALSGISPSAQPLQPPTLESSPVRLASRMPEFPVVITYSVRRHANAEQLVAQAAQRTTSTLDSSAVGRPIVWPPIVVPTATTAAAQPTGQFVSADPQWTAAHPAVAAASAAPPPDGRRPAVLGKGPALRDDIAAVLARRGANRVRYQISAGEVLLFGEIRSTAELYDLTAELSDLPGVEIVSFENLRIRQSRSADTDQ